MTPTTQQRIELEIIGMVCRFSANVFIALFIVGLMFVYVISLDHSQLTAWTWYAVLVAIAVIRWKYQAQFLRRPRDADAIGRWRAFLIVGSAVTGFAWSIPSSFLLPASLETQLFVCASLIGVVAAASGVLSPLRSAFFWFLVGTLGPAVATQFLQGGMHLFFGAGILLFMAASFAVALRHNTDVHRMLALAFENEQLAARLVEENQLAAKANERLQEEIAERTRAERSLQIAKSEADQANRAKSQFLANMSHELRTPLNAIMGTTELLCRTTLDDKQSKYARTTYRASERLLGIINDILDLARIEAGHLRVKQSVFEPRKWLSEIVELFAPQAAEKSLMITQR
ncbi:MAG TPA: histidine kinase dimerization/phospho-acceptor domain-containing protein, partial [Steroidobacteraceae bacterium]|nr:histidine kinase dimerization/phospho-acceptor domain-containing protein [Steroidobacteraceae bacterium]